MFSQNLAPTQFLHEVLVVDDNSDDCICGYLGEEYPEARCLTLRERVGTASAANEGLRRVSGDVVFIVGDDWLLNSEWIKNFCFVFRDYPTVGCIGGNMRPYWETTWTMLEDLFCKLAGQYPPDKFVVGGKEVPGGCAWRMTALYEVGFYKEGLTTGEDFELRDRVADAGRLIANVPFPKVIHNDEFGWDYAVSRIWRRGLDTMPPMKFKTLKLLPLVPVLVIRAFSKVIRYRKKQTK